ncbi:MAG: PilZ domain-containing protein [Chromatiales bacterium]|nr:PilZ domain-containing protein [Chromatiales bacterium]
MSSERREFFRVQCEVLLKVEEILEEEVEATVRSFELGTADTFTLSTRFAATTRETGNLYKRIAAQNPDVASYLSALDSKLDIIARLLLTRDLDNSPSELKEVDLSATGIGFMVRERMEESRLARTQLVLMPNYIGVDTLTRVMHCVQREGGFWVGLNFEHLRSADHELIIQHVLDCQSLQLREERKRKEQGQ